MGALAAAAVLEGSPWRELSWRLGWVLPQGWVTSGQTTNWEGAQPQPSADDWIKASLSKALPTRAVFPTASPSHQLTEAS